MKLKFKKSLLVAIVLGMTAAAFAQENAKLPVLKIGDNLQAMIDDSEAKDADLSISVVMQNSARVKFVTKKSPLPGASARILVPVIDPTKVLSKEQCLAQAELVKKIFLSQQHDVGQSKGMALGSPTDCHTVTMNIKIKKSALKSAKKQLEIAMKTGELIFDVSLSRQATGK